MNRFQWQIGYGAFSVSESNLQKVKNYMKSQQQHHQKLNFQDELRILLKKHGLQGDETYLWD